MRPVLPIFALLMLLTAPAFAAETPAQPKEGAVETMQPPLVSLDTPDTPADTATPGDPGATVAGLPSAVVNERPLVKETPEITAFRNKAARGDAAAAYQLGLAYSQSQKAAGYLAAEKWWLQAAGQGNTDAQLSLGNLYAHVNGNAYAFVNGEGVPLNYDAAFKWYRLAAGHGSSRAAYALADMFEAGWGMHPDHDTAAIWHQKGDDLAAGELKANASNEREAAGKGDARAQYDIGQSYYAGQGVPKSTPEALKWFRKSAAQGNGMAQKMLGLIYCDTTEPTQNYPEALVWYKKAAAQGYPDAEYWVGLLYEIGKGGVTQDYTEAAKWYRQAADHGNVQAQFALGYLYYLGQGSFDRENSVAQDYNEAYFWMSLARLNKDMFEALSQVQKDSLMDAAKHLTPDQKTVIKQRLLAWTPAIPEAPK